MNLFQQGDFELASGLRSDFKIECDVLTEQDWDTVAAIMVDMVHPFDVVLGVPQGGLPLQKALQKYRRTPDERQESFNILLVDDVWTTGKSMEEFRNKYRKILTGDIKYQGAVLFARHTPSLWTQAVFTLNIGADLEFRKRFREVKEQVDTIFLSMPAKDSLLSRLKRCYHILKG